MDRRADIWSFGCVLYEMLTGRQAFIADTLSDTLVAVLEREPDWAALPPDTPPAVTRTLRRCLDKDVKRRLRDIGDASLDIEDPETVTHPSGLHAAPPARRRTSALIAAVALIGASAGIIGFLSGRGSQGRSATALGIGETVAVRLTDYGGAETYGAISPDGRSFVFVSGQGGSPDIWRRQVSGGDPVRLTNDAAQETELAFAPDGETVYFTRTDANGRSIWRVGALGGDERRLIAGGSMPRPSPDGNSIAFYAAEPNQQSLDLVVSSLSGENRRRVAGNLGFGASRAAWSPDGRLLSYSRAALFGPCNLYLIDMSTGEERQVTHFTKSNEGLSRGNPNSSQHWLPDNRHIVVSYQPRSRANGHDDLGVLDIQDGSIARLTLGVDTSFSHASVSADGTRLIAEAVRPVREIWKVPGVQRRGQGPGPTRLLDAGAPFWVFVSHGGRFVLFNGSLSGSGNLWLARLDDPGLPRQVTTEGDVISHSSLSPDSTRVAFASTASGQSH
ncbi:MAG: LpqB family beta-propeller domain-containing protein, partial [Vicinamibacterales bacterium]